MFVWLGQEENCNIFEELLELMSNSPPNSRGSSQPQIKNDRLDPNHSQYMSSIFSPVNTASFVSFYHHCKAEVALDSGTRQLQRIRRFREVRVDFLLLRLDRALLLHIFRQYFCVLHLTSYFA